jgi:2-dehydro-3-deoxyphosphogluconate aldolase/(4S)-4-hydroxy-2-oxoglutarate aldolase
MNTEKAPDMVAAQRSAVPHGKLLGMGTIRNLGEAKIAVSSGAMFLVTPNTDADVIEYAKSRSVPVIAGALSPTEVYTAWSAGADMIKVFPCSAFGPEYIRELRGPYDQIPLVAVGGVTLHNMRDYFSAGARAVGAGSSLFGRQALETHNVEDIARNVKKFITLCRECGK